MPDIQTRLIPLGEQPPTASNVSARVDLLLFISFPPINLPGASGSAAGYAFNPTSPADGGALTGCYWLDSQVF